MLDIQFIRDNAELVKEKSKQKGYDVDIDQLLKLDQERRDSLQVVEGLRARRNEISSHTKGGQPDQTLIDEGKQIKIELSERESELAKTEEEWLTLLKQVPNMPADDVPVGASEDENVVYKDWGEKPNFDFQPKNHWEIAEARGWIDKERAAKVSGARFAYIKGDLVRLQLAIMQFVVNSLSDEAVIQKIIAENNLEVSSRPFTPVLPPAMIRTEMYDAMDRLEPREDRYKIEGEELWVQGSAEHTLGPMFAGETLKEADLPIRFIGFLTSFRREAGTYGKDTEGIFRMHQFDKLEMESFCLPSQGLQEHLLMVAIQEYLVQQLGLCYHMLNKCTADIGKPNARGIDLEIWLPGQNKYRETHTADFMTDYQSRRLQTRVKPGDGGALQYLHTNDATAFALGRTMVAIIENYQTAEGKVQVPEVLRTYLGGLTEL